MTTIARTVSPRAWAEASQKRAIKPGTVSEAVNKCMAELMNQPESGTYRSGYSPWLNAGGECYGAIWAGVPQAREWWKDSEGGWMISTHEDRATTASYYTRLCPAPLDAEVQYGFCPVRLNRIEEIMQARLGDGWRQLSIVRMAIGSYWSAPFRVDRMTIAAAKLGEKTNVSDVGKRFKILLGRTKLSSFIEDILRGVYSDCSGNILAERDNRHREMVQLMAESAYPGFLSLSSMRTDDISRFRAALSLEQSIECTSNILWPRLYNIVMPAPIFEEVNKNLELGIPPIVPQYVTPDCWMFNGAWGDPCTGLVMSRSGVSSLAGLKIVGGIVNRFNCDIACRASYWPFDRNPPTEWVDSFVDQLQKLRGQQLPLSTEDRADLSLLYARGIPVVIDIHHGDEPRVLRYSKLVGLNENDDGRITRITTRECNAGREWIKPPDPNPIDPPSTDEDKKNEEDVSLEDASLAACSNCGCELGDGEGYTCDECIEDLCEDCTHPCGNCGDLFCGPHSRIHAGCTQCCACDNMVSSTVGLCVNCGSGPFCRNCWENHTCPIPNG